MIAINYIPANIFEKGKKCLTNEWLQWYTCKAAFEADGWKVRTATHCNLTNMERYRSGHNEAVLKTVCPQGRVGSNPTLSVI